MSLNHLAENLRLLCARHPSVAEVCRLSGINRQQFNKYLSGVSQPSIQTLRRICNFFGVDETEIFLPPAELAAMVRTRNGDSAAPTPLAAMAERIVARHPDSQQRLQRYCGTYAGFVRSPAFPGKILRYLTVLFQEAGHTYAKTVERVVDSGPDVLGNFVSKYLGVALHGDDRIYLLDHNPQSHQVFALSVLYPNHRNRLHLLSGLSLSVSGSPGREVFASRLVLEYLGKSADRRQAMAACGLYPDDSDQISEAVRLRTRNEIGREEVTLRALDS